MTIVKVTATIFLQLEKYVILPLGGQSKLWSLDYLMKKDSWPSFPEGSQLNIVLGTPSVSVRMSHVCVYV